MRSLSENKPVLGLATLNSKLYVFGGSDDMTLYNTETFSAVSQYCLTVPELSWVADVTSCSLYKCVYIAECCNNVRLIHRLNCDSNTLTSWHINDVPDGLSVNAAHNILVTCDAPGKIKEFTTDGKLVQEIVLQSDIVHPRHAVQLTTNQFAVCHGKDKDPLHRVCIVDATGRVKQAYGGSPGKGNGQLNGPRRLAFNGFIFVADCNNDRVLMLSPTLGFVREVVSGLKHPTRLCFDEEMNRLYVADDKWQSDKWVSGQVKVFKY